MNLYIKRLSNLFRKKKHYYLIDCGGVFTADPLIEPNARLIPEIGYEEMLELASDLTKPVHPRAVELAWVNNVPVLVTSIRNYPRGTLIHEVVGSK